MRAHAVAEADCVDGRAVVLSGTLLLATGVEDDVPVIDGFAALYGRGVFHCPYCVPPGAPPSLAQAPLDGSR